MEISDCEICAELPDFVAADLREVYTYNYYYEFSIGYVEERVWLKRLAGGASS